MEHLVRTAVTFPLNTITRADSPAYNELYINFLQQIEKNREAAFIQKVRKIDLPDVFEGRKQWAGYLSPVKDQGACGGCYAFASASALSDRYNLLSQGDLRLNLSATNMIACDILSAEIYPYTEEIISEAAGEFGCNGSTLLEAWRYLNNMGTTTVDCVPETLLNRTCAEIRGEYYDTCVASGKPAMFYRAEHVYVVPGVERDGGSENSVRRNIFFHGPLTTAIEIYEDFYTLNPLEIYYHKGGKKVGGHAIVIDGWGEEGGVKFWWVRNSWGKNWGLNGYFKLERGTNCCKCEENVVAAAPALEEFGLLDPSEYNVDLFGSIPTLDAIRRYRTSTFAANGGIDQQTGISNRQLSYAENSDWPRRRRTLKTPPSSFIAGYLSAPAAPHLFAYISISISAVVCLILILLLALK